MLAFVRCLFGDSDSQTSFILPPEGLGSRLASAGPFFRGYSIRRGSPCHDSGGSKQPLPNALQTDWRGIPHFTGDLEGFIFEDDPDFGQMAVQSRSLTLVWASLLRGVLEPRGLPNRNNDSKRPPGRHPGDSGIRR